MAETSSFRNAIEFFKDLGIYDVVLPFLLVFTIVFAILEKARIFGTETVEGVEYTKKNINAMTAFVIAFLVVASSQLVAIINEALANIVLLLLLSIAFLLLIASFHKQGEVFLEGGWKTAFVWIMFVGVVLIFLHAVKTDDGEPWLDYLIDYVADNWDSRLVGSLFLVVVVIGIILYVTSERKIVKKGKPEGET